MSKNYIKGRRKEYEMIKKLKEGSYIFKDGENMVFPIAQRTAGSHSPFDIVAIHPEKKVILLLQSKAGHKLSTKATSKIEADNKELNGIFFVKFALDNGDD